MIGIASTTSMSCRFAVIVCLDRSPRYSWLHGYVRAYALTTVKSLTWAVMRTPALTSMSWNCPVLQTVLQLLKPNHDYAIVPCLDRLAFVVAWRSQYTASWSIRKSLHYWLCLKLYEITVCNSVKLKTSPSARPKCLGRPWHSER